MNLSDRIRESARTVTRGHSLRLTLQRHLQEVIRIFGHVELSLLQANHRPAVVQVRLVHGFREVILDEVGSRGKAEVPLEGLQQQQLHLQQALLGEHEVHVGHAAQAVELLQLRHAVFFFFKFTL